MNILMVHNYYQQRGGEDQVFADEANLLEQYGHQVHRFTLHNDQIETMSRLALMGKTIWNRDVYRELRSLVQQHQIQVVHFHNTFPLVSPAAYYAAKSAGACVVQTLHNYRLFCLNALFLREGKVCEDCLGQPIPLAGVRHRCYRENTAASAVAATMLTTHRLLRTWDKQVDAYIALTEFAQQKMIQGGLPARKVWIKPNFVDPDPGMGAGQGGYALFVGRLSIEKGIDLLLEAWKQLGRKIPLKILGDGTLAPQVAAAIAHLPSVEWLGRQPMPEIYRMMQNAQFLVFPSRWYEGLPRTLIESFACGTPVIASNLGAMSSFVKPYETGLHFQVGNSSDLINQVEWTINHADSITKMRHKARSEFATRYTPGVSYKQLTDIYQFAQTHSHLNRSTQQNTGVASG